MLGTWLAAVGSPAWQGRAWRGIVFAVATVSLSACTGVSLPNNGICGATPQATEGTQGPGAIGAGQVKVGLLLPLSASGNAGVAAQSMRNSAEMALAEFNSPNIQLLVKDDGGTAQGAQTAAQQAIDEGAELIIGPLFAHAVNAAGQTARSRGVSVIAFSTDSNVASHGTYLLSFLPESEVDRVVEFAIAQGKRSFVALLPNNAYGTVVEAEFQQVVGRKGARVIAIERYPAEDGAKMQEAARAIAQAAGR